MRLRLIANLVNGGDLGRAAAGAGAGRWRRLVGALPLPVSFPLYALALVLPATFQEGVHD